MAHHGIVIPRTRVYITNLENRHDASYIHRKFEKYSRHEFIFLLNEIYERGPRIRKRKFAYVDFASASGAMAAVNDLNSIGRWKANFAMNADDDGNARLVGATTIICCNCSHLSCTDCISVPVLPPDGEVSSRLYITQLRPTDDILTLANLFRGFNFEAIDISNDVLTRGVFIGTRKYVVVDFVNQEDACVGIASMSNT